MSVAAINPRTTTSLRRDRSADVDRKTHHFATRKIEGLMVGGFFGVFTATVASLMDADFTSACLVGMFYGAITGMDYVKTVYFQQKS